MDGWGKIPKAAEYAGVSARTMRKYLKKGLRHSRLPTGTVLVKFNDIDEFLSKYQSNGDEVGQITDEVLRDFNC